MKTKNIFILLRKRKKQDRDTGRQEEIIKNKRKLMVKVLRLWNPDPNVSWNIRKQKTYSALMLSISMWRFQKVAAGMCSALANKQIQDAGHCFGQAIKVQKTNSSSLLAVCTHSPTIAERSALHQVRYQLAELFLKTTDALRTYKQNIFSKKLRQPKIDLFILNYSQHAHDRANQLFCINSTIKR